MKNLQTVKPIALIKKVRKAYPRFVMGFEFEGCIRVNDYNTFINGLTAIAPKHISTGSDSSIVPPNWDTYYTREIRTTKLPVKKAIKLLQKILEYMAAHTTSGVFVTNKTCGLHINVSENKVFKENKQSTYFGHLCFLVDEKKILARFKRSNNRYCLSLAKVAPKVAKSKDPVKVQKLLERLNDMGYDIRLRNHIKTKYLAMALRDGYYGCNERIEFRAPGNKDYQLKQKEIMQTIDEIINACTQAFYKCA